MNADLRRISYVALLLAVMASDLQAEPPEQVEKEAVAAIEKWGGSVERDKGHVFAVKLSKTKVTDAGLVHLKPLTDLESIRKLTFP
jgi:hypothetical protein